MEQTVDQRGRRPPWLLPATGASLLLGWWSAPLLWGLVWALWEAPAVFVDPVYGWQVGALALSGTIWLTAHAWISSRWRPPMRWVILTLPILLVVAQFLLPDGRVEESVEVELIAPNTP